MTLLEALIYCGLFLLMLSLVYGSLLMSQGAYLRSDNQMVLQAQAMTAIRQMSEEMASTVPTTVSIGSGSTAIAFLSARDSLGRVNYDSAGRVYWQKYICYYLANAALMRKDQSITPTVTPPGSTPAPSSIAANSALVPDTLARNVSNVVFSPGPQVSLTLTSQGASLTLTTRTASRP